MSGDAVVLGSHDVARLIGAIERIERDELPPHALIGGMAVIARLGKQHRATADIDEVYLGDRGDAVQILLDRGAVRQPNGVILEDGTVVDLIAVEAFEPQDLPDDESQRSFILAHRWALDTAAPLTLVAARGDGATIAEATTPVAVPEALVAMKLASAPTRREPRLHKRASDVYDVYRLLRVHDLDGSVGDVVRRAPLNLAALTASLAERLLVREAARSIRWMLAAGAPEMEAVTAEDLRAVGEPFVERLG